MKILIFCHEFPPLGAGAGNALYHLSQAWSKKNHRVTIVTSHFKGLLKEETAGAVRIFRLPVGRRSISRATVGQHLRFLISSVASSEKIFSREKPDVCMSFLTIPAGVAAWRIARQHRLPLVTQIRGGDVPGFEMSSLKIYHQILNPLIKKIWRDSRAVIANGSGLANLAQKVFPGLSVQIIPNGVDSGFFSPGNFSKIQNEPWAIFSGRFDENQKNICMIFRIMAKVPGFKLRLIGDGKDKEKIQSYAATLGINTRVDWPGWLNKEELLKAYREAHFYLSASRAEGMPNSALEAMAAGLPLILSDIPGHRELVDEGVNGFLFPLESDNFLENKILKIISNSEVRESMGCESRKRAVERHDWKIIAQKHLDCIEAILKSSPNEK